MLKLTIGKYNYFLSPLFLLGSLFRVFLKALVVSYLNCDNLQKYVYYRTRIKSYTKVFDDTMY